MSGCVYCADHGWVIVATRPEGTGIVDEMGPCRCPRGNLVEFPESGRGPWGPDGFWRGRSVELSLLSTDVKPCPPPARWRELVAGMVKDA